MIINFRHSVGNENFSWKNNFREKKTNSPYATCSTSHVLHVHFNQISARDLVSNSKMQAMMIGKL